MYTIKNAAKGLTHLTALSRNEPIDSDIGTVIHIDKNGRKKIFSAVRDLDEYGYYPGISTISGAYRIIKAITEIIQDLFKTIIFRHPPLWTAKKIIKNVKYIVRGSIEMVPLVGNIIVYAHDRLKIQRIEKEIEKEYGDKTDLIGFFANGKNVLTSVDGSFRECFSFMCQGGARFN